MDTNLLPISFANPFAAWLRTAKECLPSEQLAKQSVDCNFFTNEGINLLQIFGVFLFTVVTTYLSNWILRKIIQRILNQGRDEKLKLEDLERSDNRSLKEKAEKEGEEKNMEEIKINDLDKKKALKSPGPPD